MATALDKKTEHQVLTGSEILVEALIRQGAKYVFAYPGGASMPLHQALRKNRDRIRTILPRHEQGGGFAAQGVSRTSTDVGVCMATSGPGATNLVTAIADAKMDSIPLVAVTGQVFQKVIGTDAFQETPIVEICRAVTKHHYMITADDPDDPESVQKTLRSIPRIVKEAFYVARTGRPGPVLIDFPKNIQVSSAELESLDFDPPMHLPGYDPGRKVVADEQVKQVVAAIRRSKRPILYVGGGIINADASEELTKFAKASNIPVTMTVMGLGAFPGDDPQSLHMLGMHGTVYANYAINDADLLLAFGVRFDDRVTGKLEEFAKHGKIVHVDIDPSEMHKNKEAHIPIIGDVKIFLEKLNKEFTQDDVPDTTAWWSQLNEWRESYPLKYPQSGDFISPQYAIEELWRQSIDRDPYIAVGVGQHQMFAAQYFKFRKPKHWLSSSGLGTMGFGLPAAMGVQTKHPNSLVVDIDGDGSILMNIQELATLHCEKLPVKILLLNNQHLGMVVQWEDRFMEGRRAHTYLGPVDHPEWLGEGEGGHYEETYPNFVTMAQSFGLKARQVRSKAELTEAIAEMINHDGPYLLDVVCPYQAHVLPMIPGGATVRDIIID
ncbi:biosynthetic-type acetolactate synthase large subunit [Planctomicrobium sp. SH668]|uniref:biosynthetic-type acetolactate synthase large subunit n=1 Tax=Planctomicrobium sp. SH668 TaxID=3448126 RepID=UPI003F5C26FF